MPATMNTKHSAKEKPDKTEVGGLHSRGAFTLVELLVVLVITTIVTVALAKTIPALLTLQQNYREESAVLEQLATEAARIEKALSLAKSVTTGAVNCVVFSTEAGGVSFETNRITGVSAFNFAAMDSNVYESTTASDPRYPGINSRSRPMLIQESRSPVSIISITVEGAQAVKRLRLVANVQVQLLDSDRTITNKQVVLERPIRLWNAQ